MKVAIISFSVKGAGLANKIHQKFNKEWDICAETTNDRATGILPKIDATLGEWVKNQFNSSDLIIFVGACAIAVRHIAPYIVNKKTDPAVLVIDDTGRNVISLLSGHIGGANEFAIKIADVIGAYPVITTASDCNNKTAVDVFAKKNGLVISDYVMAKEVESALLDEQRIGLLSRIKIEGAVPAEFEIMSDSDFEKKDVPKYGVVVSNYLKDAELFEKTLCLVPENIVVGIGCRRFKSKEDILEAVHVSLANKGLNVQAVCKICSIDLKKDEKGLLDAAKALGADVQFFTAEELSKAEGITNSSEFVKKVTGVDNVCERAAITGSDNTELIMPKTKFDGVTVAFAIKERRITFG